MNESRKMPEELETSSKKEQDKGKKRKMNTPVK
jgi:hypothetical protein